MWCCRSENKIELFQMKKILSITLLLHIVTSLFAVSVTITVHQSGYDNHSMLIQMQDNLAKVLTEINAAFNEKRDLRTAGLAMDEYAKKMLVNIWSHTRFRCDDEEIVEEGLPLRSGMYLQNIPYIITPEDEGFSKEIVQFGSVEFNDKGIISDFRFSLDVHTAAKFGECQSVVEVERRMKILKYVEHFRTAYCQKDMAYLRQVFSDDALIITGNVVMAKSNDSNKSVAKISYKKQGKEEYLSNLARAFARNKYIEVKFQQIGERGFQDDCGGITRSKNNPNIYGVTLFQEWRSSRYSDEGYIFLLWDFKDEEHPVIHLRTWQPEYIGGQKIKEEEIFSLSDFDL